MTNEVKYSKFGETGECATPATPFWNRVWGRGCDEGEISEEKRLFTEDAVNEGFNKELYRKGNSVKRFRPFSESPDFKT